MKVKLKQLRKIIKEELTRRRQLNEDLRSELDAAWDEVKMNMSKQQEIKDLLFDSVAQLISDIPAHSAAEALLVIVDLIEREAFYSIISKYKRADPALDDPDTITDMIRDLSEMVARNIDYLKTA